MAVLERDYVVPLRRGFVLTPRHKRAKKATKVLRAFLERHLKADIRIGQHLNEFIWARGMRSPPPRVAVHAIVEDIDDKRVAKVELQGKTFKEAIKPEEKVEKKSGLAGKFQQAMGGGKKDDKAEAPKAEKPKEAKAEKPVEKKAAPAPKKTAKTPKKA